MGTGVGLSYRRKLFISLTKQHPYHRKKIYSPFGFSPLLLRSFMLKDRRVIYPAFNSQIFFFFFLINNENVNCNALSR